MQILRTSVVNKVSDRRFIKIQTDAKVDIGIEFFVYVRFHITYWLAEYNSINKTCWNLGHGVDFPVLFLKLKNIKISHRNSSYGDKDKICLRNLNMFGKCNRFLLLSCNNESECLATKGLKTKNSNPKALKIMITCSPPSLVKFTGTYS